MYRRRFLATGSGVGATLLAGCAAGEHLASEDDSRLPDADNQAGNDEPVGTFRLLISDQPNAIGDFSELNVSFSSARVFRGDGSNGADGYPDDNTEDDADTEEGDVEDEEQGDDADMADDDGTDDIEENNAADDASDEDDEEHTPESEGENGDATDDAVDDDNGEEQKGWIDLDLDGATVDLTDVVGDVATPVIETPLEEGRYSSIQLSVESVEGIAARNGDDTDDEENTGGANEQEDDDRDGDDRETFPVHVPSDRLRIVRPFEVVADEELSFVFDINVIRRGQQRKYNLLPVIAKSGVVGRDVEVTEISPDGSNELSDSDDDRNGGPPDDRGGGQGRSDGE